MPAERPPSRRSVHPQRPGSRSREWIPTPRRHGEDALAYALRLTETHGFGSTERFLTEARIRRPDLTNGRGVDRLAWIGRCDPAGLASDSVVLHRDGMNLAGQRLLRSQWSSLRRRFCPLCFRDDIRDATPGALRPAAWSRVWWGVADVVTCPFHDVRLRSSCDCGRAQDWKGAFVSRCVCGRHLDRLRTPWARRAVDGYVVGRLGFGPSIPAPLLDAMPLHVALKAVGKVAEATSLSQASGLEDWNSAFAAFRNGEDGVRSLLSQTAQQSFDRTGAIVRFKALHEFARDLDDEGVRTKLLRLMRPNVRFGGCRSQHPSSKPRRAS